VHGCASPRGDRTTYFHHAAFSCQGALWPELLAWTRRSSVHEIYIAVAWASFLSRCIYALSLASRFPVYLAAMGQNPELPRCNSNGWFTSISRHSGVEMPYS
jgi:hypothetical protein